MHIDSTGGMQYVILVSFAEFATLPKNPCASVRPVRWPGLWIVGPVGVSLFDSGCRETRLS